MANQIGPMAQTDLTLSLHCDFHYQVNTFILATGAEKLHVEVQYGEYKELVAQETGIVRRQTAYVSTEQLNAADKERDHALGVVMNVITAYRTSTIETKRVAALALDAMVAPYRGINNHEKRSQTREVAGLLAVLNTEEAMAHIATLHLAEEVTELAMKNAAFEVIMGQKLQEEVERTPQTGISTEELRKLVDAKYAEIVQTVNAYAIVQPSAEIEAFITQVNALITLTKRSAAAMGKEKKEEDKDGSGEMTDESEAPETPENAEN